LFNCVSKMKLDDFSSHSKDADNTQIAFGFNFNYNGSDKHFGKGFPYNCQILFADESDKIVKYKVVQDSKNKDYIFFNRDVGIISLSFINCTAYRVFVVPVRLRRVNQEIINSSVTNKVNYGGHINIDWDPRFFSIMDLTYLGHMGIQDKGDFSMQIQDNYQGYLEFMKSKFNIAADKSVNSIDVKLSGK